MDMPKEFWDILIVIFVRYNTPGPAWAGKNMNWKTRLTAGFYFCCLVNLIAQAEIRPG
jgi:hypothetical protein